MECEKWLSISSGLAKITDERRWHDFDRNQSRITVPVVLYLELNARTHSPTGNNRYWSTQGRHLISTRMTSISVCYLNVGWIKLRRLRKSFVLLPSCRRCFAVIVPPPIAPSRWKKGRKLPSDGDKATLGLIEIEKCKVLPASSLVIPSAVPSSSYPTTDCFSWKVYGQDFKAKSLPRSQYFSIVRSTLTLTRVIFDVVRSKRIYSKISISKGNGGRNNYW